MPRKYLIVLFFVAFVGAGHALAQAPETECPPECVTDSLEIITYYPSPYGYYEELRGDKIIVGDTDNSHIDETHLPPSGTLTFEPLLDDPDSSDGSLYEGSLYYQGAIGGTKGKFRFYDGSDWQDLGGSGGAGATSIKNCDFIGTDNDGNLICSRSSLYGKVHDTSQCEGSGGVVYEETNGAKHCKFTASTCPSGWIHYEDWAATKNTRCQYDSCSKSSCTTTSHAYMSSSFRESCNYCAYGSTEGCTATCWGNWTCYAEVSEIGCY